MKNGTWESTPREHAQVRYVITLAKIPWLIPSCAIACEVLHDLTRKVVGRQAGHAGLAHVQTAGARFTRVADLETESLCEAR
jgi:hypothetical protein